MRTKNQKLKLLYLAKIMKEKTDDTHFLTMPQVIDELAKYDIEAQRKSVYDDFDALSDFGIKIIKEQRGRRTYYHVGNHVFEIAELKQLVDAVQASKYMTEEKTDILIKKLEVLLSEYNEKLHQRQVFVAGRVKDMDENVFQSIDMIHTAINIDKQLLFQYFSWNVDGEQVLHHDGDFYNVSPWALFFDNEYYYLVGFDEKEDKMKHYRVDKMLNVQISENKRKGSSIFKKADKDKYKKKLFGMYGGEEEKVTLLCKNSIANVIVDRFGLETKRTLVDSEHFEIQVDVQISNQFLGWIIALGGDILIKAPEDVKDKMRELLKNNYIC